MRRIINLKAKENFLLQIQFDDQVEKIFDLKPYFKYPVFTALMDSNQFMNVVNRGYFIEWPSLEIDLSADTLWHEGKLE